MPYKLHFAKKKHSRGLAKNGATLPSVISHIKYLCNATMALLFFFVLNVIIIQTKSTTVLHGGESWSFRSQP